VQHTHLPVRWVLASRSRRWNGRGAPPPIVEVYSYKFQFTLLQDKTEIRHRINVKVSTREHPYPLENHRCNYFWNFL
jgi:hypothetical protein